MALGDTFWWEMILASAAAIYVGLVTIDKNGTWWIPRDPHLLNLWVFLTCGKHKAGEESNPDPKRKQTRFRGLWLINQSLRKGITIYAKIQNPDERPSSPPFRWYPSTPTTWTTTASTSFLSNPTYQNLRLPIFDDLNFYRDDPDYPLNTGTTTTGCQSSPAWLRPRPGVGSDIYQQQRTRDMDLNWASSSPTRLRSLYYRTASRTWRVRDESKIEGADYDLNEHWKYYYIQLRRETRPRCPQSPACGARPVHHIVLRTWWGKYEMVDYGIDCDCTKDLGTTTPSWLRSLYYRTASHRTLTVSDESKIEMVDYDLDNKNTGIIP